MKKLLLVFTVAAFLTACNGSSTADQTTSDSLSVSGSDSAAMAPMTDSTAIDSLNIDSTQK